MPIETLATLVHQVSRIVPSPKIDRMDMGMTVEVENDQYIAVEQLENTTIPWYRDDPETESEVRNECIKQEFEPLDQIQKT